MIVFNGEEEQVFTRYDLAQKESNELADLYLSNEIFRLELRKLDIARKQQLAQLIESINASSEEILNLLILKLGESEAILLAATINLKIQLSNYE